jgi:hypothetical protein
MSVSSASLLSSVRRHGVALTAAGALVGGLVATAAPAHALVTYGNLSAGGYLSTYTPTTGSCASATPPAPTSKAWNDNGAGVTLAQSRTATMTYSGNAGDVIDARMGGSASVRATPIVASGGRITFGGSSSLSAKPRLAASQCRLNATSTMNADADVELPVGMWVTLTGSASSSGQASLQAALYGTGTSTSGVSFEIGGSKATNAAAAYLPAGTYQFYGTLYASGTTQPSGATGQQAFASSVTGSVVATFTPGGAASPVAGKGASYVALGGRSCTTNAVAATVTAKARKKATKVVVKVNGKTRVSLTGKRLKRANALSLSGLNPAANVSVVATVTPKKGKKVTVARSYRACR